MCAGWAFCAPMAGWEGSVMRSLGVGGLWILIVAGGGAGWIVSPARLKKQQYFTTVLWQIMHAVLKSRISLDSN